MRAGIRPPCPTGGITPTAPKARRGCRKGFTAPNPAVPPTQPCVGVGRTRSYGPTSRQPQPLAQEGLIIAGTPSGKWDKEAESVCGRGLSRRGGGGGVPWGCLSTSMDAERC